jgi:type III restriction enzyme
LPLTDREKEQLKAMIDSGQALPPRYKAVLFDQPHEAELSFLDGCEDIVSFVKNSRSTVFRIEYRNADGGICNYIPDFIVKRSEAEIWIIETKGREDLDDPPKWERLQQWCADATAHDGKRSFHALFVRREGREGHRPKSFDQLADGFKTVSQAGTY